MGRDLFLFHQSMGVVMHPNTTIGDGVWIYHQVTIAADSVVGSKVKITLGDHVTIGAKSIIIGSGDRSIHIGSGAVIAAGSVVVKDVPSGEIWAGNPAKFIKANPQWNGKTVRRWNAGE